MKKTNIFIRFSWTVALIAALMTAWMPETEAASAGVLDATFDNDGKVVTTAGAGAIGNDIAIQTDGKIVVIGRSSIAGNLDFFVLRYNPNGTLDTNFGGGDGIASADFSGQIDTAASVAIQTDGKIVVAGITVAATQDFAVARFNADGTLDTTFDKDGKVTIDFNNNTDNASGVAIQTDGKIIVAGRVLFGNFDFGLARYNTDGSLDTTFDTDGKVSTDFNNGSDSASDVAIQSDGKIIVVGDAAVSGVNFALVRYNPNGSPDTTFDTDGKVNTDFNASNDWANSVAIQSDGKIVAAGAVSTEAANLCGLARYHANGSLDTSFDGDGKITTNVPFIPNQSISDIALQSDGKVVATVIGADFTLLRYNPNGSLDNGFGLNGVVYTNFNQNDTANGVAIQTDGKILVAGNINNAANFALARYLPNGQPSGSSDFDGDGFTDAAIFRPGTGTWYILHSLDQTVRIIHFGLNGDVPLGGDFDGDGRADLSIFRPSSGEWWINHSSTGAVFAVQFGQNTDKPVVSDFDKDGRTDIVFWRPSNGNWFVLRSSDNFSSFFSFPFGLAGDIPIGAATP